MKKKYSTTKIVKLKCIASVMLLLSTFTSLFAQFPDATTAGVPNGTVLKNGVSRTITIDNTVVDGERISTGQGLTISAKHVTIKNCWITSSFGTGTAVNGTGVISISAGASVTIIHCKLDGSNATHAGIWYMGDSLVAKYNDIFGTNDGIFLWDADNFDIEENYLHDFSTAPSNGHIDGFQTEGGSHGVIRHNTFNISQNQNACISIWNSRRNSDDILVDHNLMKGGGFNVYAEDYSPSEASPAGGYSVTNIRFTNNVFSKANYPCVGNWGIWYPRGFPTDGWIRSGNTILETGQNVDNGEASGCVNEVKDQIAPSTPLNLAANSTSTSQINLSWNTSTDNKGVRSYKLERCQGAGCTNFSEIALPTSINYSDAGLAAKTLYRYRVSAIDSCANLSGTSTIAETTTQAAATNFSIKGGKIIDPDGNVFNARGINNGLNNNMTDILNFFPCINFIRWPSGNYQSASYFQSFIDYMTARKIVVELEYHPWPLINAQSGSALTSETNWYTSLANTYKNNPYVWFGTMNEPQGGDITAEQIAVYNAIRNAGANNIIMMEVGVGSGDPGQEGPASLNASSYTNLTNIVWDFHFYGWESNYSTNQATVNSKLLGAVNTGTGVLSIQQITSKDGVVPVINGEFGNSTNGSSVDANGDQVIYAVTVYGRTNNYTSGYAAWHWTASSDPLADRLVYNNALTSYGTQIANAIANDCTPNPPSPNATFCNAPAAPVIDGTAESNWDLIPANTLGNTIAGTATSATDISATYKTNWDNNNLYILVNVTDDVKKNDSGNNFWDDDAIELFIDGNNDKTTTYDGNDRQYIFRWNDNAVHQMSSGGATNPAGVSFAQSNTSTGYIMEIKIAWTALGVTPAAAKLVGFDVHVDDDDNGGTRDNKISWFTKADNSYADPSTFGTIQLASSTCAQMDASFCTASASPVIDGTEESSWSSITVNSLSHTIVGTATTTTDISAKFKTTWDNNNLYVLVNATDDVKKNDSGANTWDDDGVELFIDGNNDKTSTYDSNDRHYSFRWNDATVYDSYNSTTNPTGVSFAQSNTSTGYIMEIKIAWSSLGVTASAGKYIGLDVHVNDDDDGGTRDNKITWIAQTDVSYLDPSTFGNSKLDASSCNIATEITESKQSYLLIYPNPSYENFYISISNEIVLKDAVIKIYDIYGKEIKTVLINSPETIIDCSELESGIYFYSFINNNDKIAGGKLVRMD